ncbi:uncharacterized protein LOC134288377 [Aedes albopictus]|uniref:Reverse transcriptase domain-containing protein n=1 Tax=Aedes albopictus TaxID=7160 RepID=A0ABM1YD06_AEDAL
MKFNVTFTILQRFLSCTSLSVLVSKTPSTSAKRTINRFKKAILNLEIKQTFYKMQQITQELNTIKCHIQTLTSESVTDEYLSTQRMAYNNWLNRQNGRTARKLTNMLQTPNSNEEPTYNEHAILNATELEVPANVLHLLSLGPRFALPTTSLAQVPFYHLFADVEGVLLTNTDKDVQDRNRCRIVNVTLNFIHGFHSMVEVRDPTTKFCVAASNETKSYLREHPEICVLSADKGNRTVIMMREDYDQKMRALVSDTTTYQKVRADPTSSYQKGNNSIVKRLQNLKLIDYRTARELASNNAICPRIYGQPKSHKQNLPLRPVIPNITAPTYKLARYVANILQSSLRSQYSTYSSFDFCKEVNGFKIPEGYIMISLDVTSLFTNVPRHLVIRNIIERWNEVTTEINLDLFLEIVEYCMGASYFCFEGQFFKQTYGTAMGSPLSPIAADIVLDSVITKAMSSLPFETTIFWKYVDDIFMVIPRNTEQQVLDAFNGVEPRLQFTIETEQDGKLAFLDMTVIRNPDQTLTTEWYAKPIASGRMLNYKSFHQPKHKMNVAKNFIHRVCSLTQNKSMDEITTIIHQHLRKNGYPKQLINRLLQLYTTKTHPTPSIVNNRQADDPPPNPPSRPSCQQSPTPAQPPPPPAATTTVRNTHSQPPPQSSISPALHRSHTQTTSRANIDEIEIHQATNPPTEPCTDHQTTTGSIHDANMQVHEDPPETRQEKTYRSLPYIPTLSQRIAKILAKDYPDISITTRQQRTINELHTIVKYPKRKEEISNVIYKIPCNDCNNCYIGMTRNNLHRRLAGHRSNVNKLEKMINDNTNTDTATNALVEATTALIQHCVDHNHRFNLDQTQIIDHSNKQSTLPFLEMCHITNTEHTVNKRTDIDRLSTTYAGVLHSIKNIDRHNKIRSEDHLDES